MCDQLRHDYLGCTGHPSLKTPNIDSLAENGVLYEKAYSASPVCVPARTSLLTGLNPYKHGITGNWETPFGHKRRSRRTGNRETVWQTVKGGNPVERTPQTCENGNW